MDIGKSMQNAIIDILQTRLSRDLTNKEIQSIRIPRGYLGYESIIDYFSDNSNTKEEIENYLKKLMENIE
jgi:arginine repressor